MDITIFMVESHNGIVDIVSYFDTKGNIKKADFSKHRLNADDVDYQELANMIEAKEYEYERN